ncbi:MAG: energy-coupling factor transport system permease protein [Deferribacteres bacterium]|jgi:energy-coupling factor transport system permease protein|nr:energy-coupling factor transport system permease protein [Deferribacteres bacterium]
MKKVVIGKYIHKKSFFHRLNPLTKFIITILLLIFIGLGFNYFTLVCYTLITLFLMFLSKITIGEILKLLKPFRFLLLFTLFIQLFYDNAEMLNYNAAILYTSKFTIMIILSSIFTVTTRPIDIVKIVYKIIKPFKFTGINPVEIATSCIIALRFIPLIFEEADNILTAQRLRGIIPQKGIRLLFSLHTFVIPLFNRVFYYAEQISITLNYRTNWESILTFEKLKLSDHMLIIFSILGCYGISFLQ